MKKNGSLFYIVALTTALIQAEDVDFSLPDTEDTVVTLSDYRGKIVVLDFWATWCASCYKAFPILNEIQDSLHNDGVVLGINLEKINNKKLGRFVQRAKIRYTVLKDPNGETAKQFGVKGLPSIVVIDTTGSVVKLFRGVDKNTEKGLLQALDSLTAEQPG